VIASASHPSHEDNGLPLAPWFSAKFAA
jgi:hypothetical protein